MSVSEIERFKKDVTENTALKEEFIQAGTAEEAVVSFASGKGYDFTVDELKAEIEEKKANLSNEDLEKVAAAGLIPTVSFISEPIIG